ncbi:MAG TPA: hypothetical protein VLH15_03335 [Dehalococcoidales bacterium]|nr:hypothetical protein [Dehalococcoidales bacterium]
MTEYIPMLVLMGMFGTIGLYWALGARHFITWSRKYENTFPRFSDNPGLSGSNAAAGVKSHSTILKWGIRLIGVALSLKAVGAIVNIIIWG